MLLSAFDPALLIYNYEDWQARADHCFRRCEALTLHRRTVREYNQRIAMSYEFASLVYQSFPWNGDFRAISELRDLRQFVLQELEKVVYVETRVAKEANLQPTGIVCQHIDAREVIDAWEELLCGCVNEAVTNRFEPQIATWETATLCEHSGAMMTLIVHDSKPGTGIQVYRLPLVWDDQSWAIQLATQDWWPDLQRCVELHFRTNAGIRDYPGRRGQAVSFECTDAFWKSVDRFCRDRQLRFSLIEALTKRVYEVFDASLGDESLGGVRRFRVTDFWRVHYHEEGGRLVLEELGPHSMGGVG